MTLEEMYDELADIQEAIRRIRRGGQSYNLMSRGVQHVSYEALVRQRDQLLADIAVAEEGREVLYGWDGR